MGLLDDQVAPPLFREQRRGAIVDISSLSGKVGNLGQTDNGAAKAGLVGPTKASAKVASVVVLVASPMAPYVTGAVIEVTGGRGL